MDFRFTKSEEDLTAIHARADGSPRPEFSVYGSGMIEFDDADCWSQEDDDIIAVSSFWERIFLLVVMHCGIDIHQGLLIISCFNKN